MWTWSAPQTTLWKQSPLTSEFLLFLFQPRQSLDPQTALREKGAVQFTGPENWVFSQSLTVSTFTLFFHFYNCSVWLLLYCLSSLFPSKKTKGKCQDYCVCCWYFCQHLPSIYRIVFNTHCKVCCALFKFSKCFRCFKRFLIFSLQKYEQPDIEKCEYWV